MLISKLIIQIMDFNIFQFLNSFYQINYLLNNLNNQQIHMDYDHII